MNSKKIAFIGFLAFIGIVGCLTAAFNWFWSGLGDDPSRYKILPLTNDLNEFKDYAALYIPLISFGATLFAGFVVFAVFTDWKDQHNKTIVSKEAKDAFNQVHLERHEIQQLNFIVKNLDRKSKLSSKDKERIIDLSSKLVIKNNTSKKDIACFLNLSKKLKIYNTINDYFNEVGEYNKWLKELIKNDYDFSNNILELKEKITNLMKLNQSTLDQLRELVFIK